jgi:hypothetical protein
MVGAPIRDPSADRVARSNHGSGQWREGPLTLFGVYPMRGCPRRRLSKMKSDWGISGREGMNIMDTQTKRPLSPDSICFGPFRLSAAERVLEKVASRSGLAAVLSTFSSPSSSARPKSLPRRSYSQECGRTLWLMRATFAITFWRCARRSVKVDRVRAM